MLPENQIKVDPTLGVKYVERHARSLHRSLQFSQKLKHDLTSQVTHALAFVRMFYSYINTVTYNAHCKINRAHNGAVVFLHP